MLRLTLATVMSLGLVGAAKAGEFDNDAAKPSKAKSAAAALAADLNGGSEFDKESPAQAHRYRGWGGRWGGGWGGWGGGWNRGWGGWNRGWGVNINIGRGWGGWGGWGYPRWGWGGWNRGWGGWGYRSYYSYPTFTSYPFYSSYVYTPTYYSSYFTPVYYSSVGFAPCYY